MFLNPTMNGGVDVVGFLLLLDNKPDCYCCDNVVTCFVLYKYIIIVALRCR